MNVNLEKLTGLLTDGVISTPPYYEGSGRRMVIHRMGKWDPEKYSLDEVYQFNIAIMEMGILEPQGQILGSIAIFDFEDYSLQQAWYFTPSYAYKSIQILTVLFSTNLILTSHDIFSRKHSL